MAKLSLTWLFAPIMLFVAWLYLRAMPSAGSNYPLNEQVAGLSAVVLVLPFVALSCAVAASRVRAARILDEIHGRRSTPTMAMGLVALPALTGTIVLWASMAWESGRFTGQWIPDARLASIAGVESVAFSLVGLGVGLWAPTVVAIPTALVLPYMMIAFPPAVSPLWIRHLTYVSTNCCTVDSDLSTRALGGHLLTMAALICAGLALAHHSTTKVSGRGARIGGVIVPTSCVAVGALLVQGAGATLVADRDDAMACRRVGNQTLCLWPEDEGARALFTPLLLKAQRLAADRGIPAPSKISDLDKKAHRWPEASGWFNDRVPLEQRADVVADLYIPECGPPESTDGDSPAVAVTEDPRQTDAAAWRLWWHTQLTGASGSALDVPPGLRARVVALERLSPQQRHTSLQSLRAQCSR